MLNTLGLQSIVFIFTWVASMLVTSRNHELPEFPFRQELGARAWRAVSLELNIPYIFVSYACLEGVIWITQSSILWRDEDVISVCRELQSDSSRRILQISLLVPPSLTKTENWHMQLVHQIWTGSADEGISVTYLNVDGERLSSRLSGNGTSDSGHPTRLEYPVEVDAKK